MKRITGLFFMLIITAALILPGCRAAKEEERTPVELVYRFSRSAAGDAKLMSSKILMTCINRSLIALNFETGEVMNSGIEADWLSVLPEENLVIYTNHNKQLGVVHMNDDGTVKDKRVVLKNDDDTVKDKEESLKKDDSTAADKEEILEDDDSTAMDNEEILDSSADFMIDPAIIKIDDMYYFTLTFVSGNLNSASEDELNGQYTINCYCTKDWKKLEMLSQVTSEYRNLEDVKLAYNNEKFYLVYEKESRDKANSSIMVSVSENMGKSWSEADTVLNCVADQEPAGLVKTEEGWNLYYSSDIANPGSSYDGALAYMAKLTDELVVIEQDIPVGLMVSDSSSAEGELKEGILLYCVEDFKGRTYFAYSEDHATADNLCVSATVPRKDS